jgi:hypothetical protein
MTTYKTLASLLLLPLMLSAACGSSDGTSGDGSTGDALASGDAIVSGDGGASDAAASDGAPASDASVADAVTTSPDGASATPDATKGDASAELGTIQLLWGASINAYIDTALPQIIMIAGIPAGMTGPISTTKACPEGGSYLLTGTATKDTMGRTTSDLVMNFAMCKFNGLIIEGKWNVKQDVVFQMGGHEDYSGDLTYSGSVSRTCATMVRRNITATNTQSFTGMFCGSDIATW